MKTAAPVRYFAAVEDIQSDESETIAQLNDTFDTILETTAKDYAHAVRSVHAKAHGILEGTLLVEDGLPPELAQGIAKFSIAPSSPDLRRLTGKIVETSGRPDALRESI